MAAQGQFMQSYMPLTNRLRPLKLLELLERSLLGELRS